MSGEPNPHSAIHVPLTQADVERVQHERPSGWEYLLFAGLLHQGKDQLELLWRDHQLALARGPYRKLEDDEVPGFMSESFGRLAWTLEPLERVFAAQEEAFGRVGEPGDARLITHLAGWVITAYRSLLDWASDVRSAGPPDELQKALTLTGHAADKPIDDIRAFISQVVSQASEIAEYLALPEDARGEEPLTLSASLTIEADNALMDEAVAELRSALA
jgi:hypothetical protein